MTSSGPGPFEDGADWDDRRDDEGSLHHEAGEAESAGDADARLRGWVPPDDRLWRHPSEVHASAPSVPAGPRPEASGTRMVSRRRTIASGLIAGTAIAAIAAGVLLLTNADTGPGSGTGTPVSPTLSKVTGCCRDVPAAARDALESMVSLQVTTAHGAVQTCGIVVAGGLVATTLDAVAGARSITAVTATGRRLRAVLVAGDPSSDVAVVRVDGGLPAARFTASTQDTGRRGLVLAVALAGGTKVSGRGAATMLWAGSSVRAYGADITGQDGSGMGGIDAAAPSMPSMSGEALVGDNGQVLGLLDASASTRGLKVFLPAALVIGVARSLAATGSVRHGWLDVVGEDAGTPGAGGSTTTTAEVGRPGGAMVTKVEAGGAAAGVLQPGDVITSIDHAPLASMAALRSSLYVTAPGEHVELGIRRGTATLTVDVALSASP